MVEHHQVAFFHIVAHEIARLIVTYTIPGLGLFATFFKVGNAEFFGF